MSLRSRPRRNAYGFVLPTRLMVFSISVVALAGLVFVATQGDESPDRVTPSSSASAPPTEYAGPQNESTEQPEITPSPTPKPPPVVKRDAYSLVVFNNTNTKGLAGKTATRAEKAGWTVINTDNWVGSVDASTVYYGPKMKAAAALLAKDLGIKRIKPFISPMRPDRLTVILTTDYQ